MDRFLSWLDTEFPPGWFDGMELAPDWLSVVNLILVALLGWKTLGPRRQTKIKLRLSDKHVGPGDENGYRKLVVLNRGHYPAHGVTVHFHRKDQIDEPAMQLGDISPWEGVDTGIMLRHFEGGTFYVAHRNADNNLVQQRLKANPGHIPYALEREKNEGVWISRTKRPTFKSLWKRGA
ncbi:hypothetical protein [Kocuria rosea]|uniref:hypothetical protein n=1 Tax=Kocuria rosea TaxID=1275 RepID=UPI0011A78755|nr:hypothetical protein [Kocuria rosea]